MNEDPLGAAPDDPENNGKSIEERAAEGDAAENHEPDETVYLGDEGAQLSLNLGGVAERNVRKVDEAQLALQAHAVPTDALLRADEEYEFLVRGRVKHYVTIPVRKDGRVVRYKQRQPVEVLRIRRAAGAEAIGDLFAELLEADSEVASSLLKSLGEMAEGHVAEPVAA